MKPRHFVPGQCWRYFACTLLLTAVVAALLIWVNEDYLFHAKLYETGDPAANSLSVLRAAHGHEIYGAYSRWGFHHPGPALFYSFALGEGIAFHWLHLTPTPFNAQILTVIVLLASFFAASLSLSARWVRSWLFLPLALAFAALHFTALDGRMCWVNVWPAYVMPLIFLALVVAAASVGAGQGEDLPLLALAGCFLLHLHVAQPLFVGPMFGLAYAGLAWSCWRRKPGRASEVPSFSNPTARPWRIYRKAHLLSVVIAGGFALPMLVDLIVSKRSNFSEILGHLHSHPAVARPWENCVQYFLHFGAYKPSIPGVYTYQRDVSWLGVRHYTASHPKMATLWLGALFSPLLALAVRVVRRRPAAVPFRTLRPVPGRWRFLGWLAFCWAVSVALTMYWAHIQDGELFYYNAWFNYSIYYLLALLAAGALSDTLETITRRTAQPLAWRTLIVLICIAVGGINLAGHPVRYRASDADDDDSRIQANTVRAALADEAGGGRQARMLVYPHDGWQAATGIAALLDRADVKSYVTPDWRIMFGQDHVVEKWDVFLQTRKSGLETCRTWHLIPAAHCPTPGGHLLTQDYVLVPGGLDLDPTVDAAVINFAGEGRNADAFALEGWETPPRDDVALSNEAAASLQFHAHPVPADASVEMTLDADPCRIGGVPAPQRVVAHLNGSDLGTFILRPNGDSTNRLTIPAARWNQHPDAFLILDFPDSHVAPETRNLPDQLPRAIATRRISFRLASASPVAEAALETPPPTPTPTPTQESGMGAPISPPVEPVSPSEPPEASPTVQTVSPPPTESRPEPGSP